MFFNISHNFDSILISLFLDLIPVFLLYVEKWEGLVHVFTGGHSGRMVIIMRGHNANLWSACFYVAEKSVDKMIKQEKLLKHRSYIEQARRLSVGMLGHFTLITIVVALNYFYCTLTILKH